MPTQYTDPILAAAIDAAAAADIAHTKATAAVTSATGDVVSAAIDVDHAEDAVVTARDHVNAAALELTTAATSLSTADAAATKAKTGLSLASAAAASTGATLSAAGAQLALAASKYLVVVPPPVVEPPPVVTPPTSAFPVPPTPPAYSVPTEAQCDWVIAAGVATSKKGLPPITASAGLIPAAYRASRKAGHAVPITVGVKDNGGRVDVAFGESQWDPSTLWVEKPGGGYEDILIRVVGLTPTAEIGLGFGIKWGRPGLISISNIGIRGPNNSFVLGASTGVDVLVLDGCWWLPCKAYAGTTQTHASGMHIDQWGTLIWRNHKWRGETPTAPGINLREHSGYLKSCVGAGTWILNNDLRGGNRTGFQIRPTNGENPRPTGAVVVTGNTGVSCGWNMGSTPADFDGGCVLTVWANPDFPTYVYDNTITDAKYGCLNIGGQPKEKNYLNDHGYPDQRIWIRGNKFENSHTGHPAGLPKRDAVAFCGVEEVNIGANEFLNGARLALNDEFGMKEHGIKNGKEILHLADAPAYEIRRWSGTAMVPLTTAEKTALLATSVPIGTH